ncbi:twin-arginine translocase TatA/TatE family subunit [Chloroflexota bacterium]
MPHIGIPELIIILVILFVIFGAGKLPQVGSALGKAIHELRKPSSALDEEEKPKRKKRAKKSA